MAKFLVRVELHGASRADYDELHDAMELAGFSREIYGADARWHQLPNAEYTFEGAFTPNVVLAAAKRAAASTGLKFSVLVGQYTALRWSGLTTVS